MINIFCIRPKGFNVGNDVIYLGVRQFLYESFGRVVNVIPLPASSRFESEAQAGLTAQTVYDINQFGHGVIVGGGNLYENGQLDVDPIALAALDVPLMLFSLSRGRVYSRQSKLVDRTDAMPDDTLRMLNRRAEFSLARDKATCDYLHGLGLDHVELGGCPTIFLDQMMPRLPELSQHDRAGALVSVRNPGLMSIPLVHQARVRADILGMMELLRAEGIDDIRLLCHDHRDIAFAASFPGVDYVYTDDVYSYLALLRGCALNISYRLHSFLPCLAFGTPTIKISYDERALSLVETIGLGDWNINMVRSDDVVAQVTDRYSKLNQLPGLITGASGCWDGLRETTTDAFRRFAEAVNAAR